jgi:two-component system, sensor histidine kinase and response regulator
VNDEMLRESLSEEPVLNPMELLERVEGDRELLHELVGLFREDWPKQMEALRGAAAAKNARGVAAASHTLKGMLANLTAAKAAGMAAGLEMAARRGESWFSEGDWASLEREITRVDAALEGIAAEVKQ